jgi:hypothetical protein
MQKSALLAAFKKKSTTTTSRTLWMTHPRSRKAGRGVAITGCSRCLKQFGTVSQFIDHLTQTILPPLIDKLSTEGSRDV